MDKNLVILAAFLIIVFFVVGAALGIFYQIDKDAAKIQGAENMSAAVKALSSDSVQSIVAFGQVKKITGRTIVLSYAGKTLSAVIANDAKIFSFASAGQGASQGQKEVSFNSIKEGDSLNIILKLYPDGRIEGRQVIIFSGSI